MWWPMTHGAWNKMSNYTHDTKNWHMTHDTWQMTHDTWHMTHDTRHMTHDIWQMNHEKLHMTHETRHMTYDTWHIAYDAWCMTQSCFVSWFHTRPWLFVRLRASWWQHQGKGESQEYAQCGTWNVSKYVCLSLFWMARTLKNRLL